MLALTFAALSLLAISVDGHALRDWSASTAAVVCGVASASAVIAICQYVQPAGILGWIEPLTTPGRAFANLRQPNHLALLLAWGLIAATFLYAVAEGRVWQAAALGTGALLVVGLALTGSRMAMAFALILGAWGLADRGLPTRARQYVLAIPLVFALAALALWGLNELGSIPYFGSERLERMASGEASLSGHRVTLWLNTIEMIRQHPWTGVGWGQFNLHYSLGTFERPALPVFTHAHNLPLHLAAELGVPAAAAACLAFGAWAWRCRAAMRHEHGRWLAAGLTLLLMHSMLELPLWYAYFLLPGMAAVAALSAIQIQRDAPGSIQRQWAAPAAAVSGLLVLALAAALAWDYAKVVPAYSNAPTDRSLEQRVARAGEARFFRHAGLYARVVTLPVDASLARELPLMQATARLYVDAELMRRWAIALVYSGDVDAAEHLVWRLWRYNPSELAPLKAFADGQPSPHWRRLAAYLDAPTPVNLPVARLVPPSSSRFCPPIC